MTENLSYNSEFVWKELVHQARESAITSEEAFRQLVDEYVEEKVRIEELDPDQDTHQLKAEITGRWADFRQELGI